MRDELLNGEIFDTMAEAMVLIEGWRAYYNTVRPHSSLEYRPPTLRPGWLISVYKWLDTKLRTVLKTGVRS